MIQDLTETPGAGQRQRLLLFVVAAVLFAVGLYLASHWLSIDALAAREQQLKDFYAKQPTLTLAIAFLIYVAVTSLSIPGAAVLSLVYAWFFKFQTAVLLLSFASTTGATIAFLLCRYLFRDWVQLRFGNWLQQINEAFEREGAYYLFTMRLIPAIPFVAINAVMGLTRISTLTFFWVSQLGMLAGTIVYAYAGASIPDLVSLKEKGIKGVFTAGQLWQITIAFVLLGVFPLVAKKGLEAIMGKRDSTK